jgi:hypothetical protein
MKRRLRKVLLVVLAGLAVIAVALLLWLPWNPFEAGAGPLDEWVPAGSDAVARFDAAGLRGAPAVLRLWNGPIGYLLRDRFELDGLEDGVRDADRTLAGIPGLSGDPPTVERDLAGGEALVAVRGGAVLAMTRISARAKAIDLIRRAGDERRAQWGIRVEGDAYVVGDGDRTVRFARRRDVLLASNSAEFLAAALSVADGRGDSVVSRAEYAEARPPVPTGATASAWVSKEFAAKLTGKPELAEMLLGVAFEGAIRLDLDASKRESVTVTTRVSGPPAGVADAALANDAASLAVGGAATVVASGAVPISAHDAVSLLFDSQPPARRRLVDDLLAESGSSVDAVVADLSKHLAPGAGFVVARLREAGVLRLDSADGDPVEPIPATLAVFRIVDRDAEPFVADLRRHAKALFGQDARVEEETGANGARVFRPTNAPFGPEWALLSPVLAVRGDRVIFCTNEQYLAAALDVGARHERTMGPGFAVARVDAGALRVLLLDQRWNVADRATRHDWAAERQAIRAELDRTHPESSSEARQTIEDYEIARRIRQRKSNEFPAAIEEYRDSLEWLRGFTDVEVRCVRDGDRLRIDVTIGIQHP